MKKYRKKPVIIEAEQWFTLGDVPEAGISGKIPTRRGWVCGSCKALESEHGMLRESGDDLDDYMLVCPGDWIIKGVEGEFYPCKPSIFEKTYEVVDEE